MDATIAAGTCAMMTVMRSVCARSATKMLCACPGLIALPHVPARTAAPAIAGCTPAAMSVGMRMLPTAAEQPAALGMAMLIHHVSSVASGMRMNLLRVITPEMDSTRWRSQVVIFMTNEKPMTVQITGTSEPCTIVLLNVATALPVTPPIKHMRKPAESSTMRVSYFLMMAAKERMTMIPPVIANKKTSFETIENYTSFRQKRINSFIQKGSINGDTSLCWLLCNSRTRHLPR